MEMTSLSATPTLDLNKGVMNSDLSDPLVKRGHVAIIGTGDMAMALCSAMVRSGIRPVLGSRTPERARSRLAPLSATVETVPEAVKIADIILVAVPVEHRVNCLPIHLVKGKILVDVCNRASEDHPSDELSLAEQLQANFPEAFVVKAFNTLSSYALQQGNVRGSREVQICSDADHARARIFSLVRKIGLIPADFGGLRNARQVEDFPFSFFPQWKTGNGICAVTFLLFYLLLFMRRQICPNLDSEEWEWNRFQTMSLKNGMLASALTAGVLLMLCYVPGILAAYIQLYRGTKYSPFPRWLDSWLKIRKQLGLWSFLLGFCHAIMAIFTTMNEGMTSEWAHQLFLTLGVVLLALLSILAASSIPSIASGLSWKEFDFLQRTLGWMAVVLLTLHAFFKGYEKLLKPRFECLVLPSETQIIVFLCLLTLLLKLPLLLPCVHFRLKKIRRGYERKLRGSPA